MNHKRITKESYKYTPVESLDGRKGTTTCESGQSFSDSLQSKNRSIK